MRFNWTCAQKGRGHVGEMEAAAKGGMGLDNRVQRHNFNTVFRDYHCLRGQIKAPYSPSEYVDIVRSLLRSLPCHLLPPPWATTGMSAPTVTVLPQLRLQVVAPAHVPPSRCRFVVSQRIYFCYRLRRYFKALRCVQVALWLRLLHDFVGSARLPGHSITQQLPTYIMYLFFYLVCCRSLSVTPWPPSGATY